MGTKRKQEYFVHVAIEHLRAAFSAYVSCCAAYRAAIVEKMSETDALKLIRRNGKHWSQDEGLALFLLADSLSPGWQKKHSENPKFLLLIYCRALLSETSRAVKSTPVLSMLRHKTVN